MSLVTQMRCFKAVCETGGFKAATFPKRGRYTTKSEINDS